MTGSPFGPSLVVADRYRIEREIGRGGMATVWLATDQKHARSVAIKVLDPVVASIVGGDRFLREIQVLATLQHPHIVPLFDSGEVDGHPYYVMPYVDGESLEKRLAHRGRLGLDEVKGLARHVASALDFAHRRGIVHRDIKPANILISDGHALVSDFGIARAIVRDAETAQRLTATGVSIGTPGYMSPEQAVGELAIDARTDVYALAAVTHEMLAGDPPFVANNSAAVVAKSLTERPPSLDQLRRGLPPGIAAAIQRGLAFEPADRYQTPLSFVDAIDAAMEERRAHRPAIGTRVRMYAAIAAGIATLSVGAWFLKTRRAPGGQSRAARVAVLPFREAGDTSNAGFTLGLADAIRSDLGTLPGVEVIAASSISALGDSVRSPKYVAEQLGATHVLAGTVQWSRSRAGRMMVMVVPEVVDRDGNEIAGAVAQRIEDRVDETFGTQRRVSAQIAQSLGVPLSAEAMTRLARPPTRNQAAYEAFLKSQRDQDNAVRYLEQAVALDSTFAEAWAWLARAAAQRYRVTLRPALAAVARRAAERAVSLDSASAAAHVGAALVQRNVERDFATGVRHAAIATQLAPGDPDVLAVASIVNFHAGKLDEALALVRRAAVLDPRNGSALARVENILQWRRELPEAEEYAGRAIAATQRRAGFVNLDSVWLPLMRGNKEAALRFSASLPDSQARADLAVIADRDWLQGWAIDTASVQLGVRVLEGEGDRAFAYIVKTREAWRKNNKSLTLRMADSALAEGLARLRVPPREERLQVAVGYSQALAGRCAVGLAHADTAVATRSAWKDAFFGAGISLVRAQMLALCGRGDASVALLDSLSTTPGFVTPEWLSIDPHFVSLARNRQFRALARLAPVRP